LTYQDALHLEYTIYFLHFFVNNAKTLGTDWLKHLYKTW